MTDRPIWVSPQSGQAAPYLGTGRKRPSAPQNAVSRVFALPARPGSPAGPVHAVYGDMWGSQAWCGTRPQFRHRETPNTARWEDVVSCEKCLRALRRGHPYARGSR